MTTDKKRILIGIPTRDSKVYANTMISIYNNIKELEALGHFVTFSLHMKGPYLDLSRNKIANDFLIGDFTDLIFIDADIAFEYDAISKLLSRDVQVVGGVYPYHELEDKGFPIEVRLDENKRPIIDFDLGLLECLHIPTGFMRIRRDVFDILNEKYPGNRNDKNEAFHFRTGILFADRGDRQYYGEDVYFCKICNEAGIKVYCDPTIEFIHFGTLPKKGRYSDFLKKGGVE